METGSLKDFTELRAGFENESLNLRSSRSLDDLTEIERQRLMQGGPQASLLSAFVAEIPSISTALLALLTVWIGARFGRTIKLDIGGMKAEARSVGELSKLMRLAEQYRDTLPVTQDSSPAPNKAATFTDN